MSTVSFDKNYDNPFVDKSYSSNPIIRGLKSLYSCIAGALSKIASIFSRSHQVETPPNLTTERVSYPANISKKTTSKKNGSLPLCSIDVGNGITQIEKNKAKVATNQNNKQDLKQLAKDTNDILEKVLIKGTEIATLDSLQIQRGRKLIQTLKDFKKDLASAGLKPNLIPFKNIQEFGRLLNQQEVALNQRNKIKSRKRLKSNPNSTFIESVQIKRNQILKEEK